MRRCHHNKRKTPAVKVQRIVVARGRDRAGEGTKPSKRAVFQGQAATRTAAEWPIEGTAEEKWAVMKRAPTDTATECLGVQERYHPDWFKESARDLQPVLQHRKLYTKWLATKNSDDHRRFKKARGEASVPSDGPKIYGLWQKQSESDLERRRCGDASGTNRGGEGGCVHQ